MNYGIYGGQYVPSKLKEILKELDKSFEFYKNDKDFKNEYLYYLKNYVGRPSSLYLAKNLTDYYGGSKIYLKREDLNHTGSHKINNTIGQILLAKRMHKTEVIAETGAGQHGVATATVCALFGMKCKIFMGELDMERQKVNVERMRMLGATVIPAKTGSKTLKEAVDEALDYYVNHLASYYLIGSVVGPYPYPKIVKYFQKIIGEEARKQILKQEGKLPKAIIACVGGGSNAMGIMSAFINDNVDLYGIEGAGLGLETTKHASAIANNKVGVIHGMKTYVMSDDNDNIMEAYSISSGLDYPGIGPEHAYLHDDKRVQYDSITDDEAINAFKLLCDKEGIIPALESSHALAYIPKIINKYSKNDIIIVNLSGRGDKDINTVINYKGNKQNESL